MIASVKDKLLKMQVTNFYFPGWGQRLRIVPDQSSSSSSSQGESIDESEEDKVPEFYGFVGARDKDISYSTVLESIGFSHAFIPQEPQKEPLESNSFTAEMIRNRSPMYAVTKEETKSSIKTKVIISWEYLDQSPSEVSDRLGLEIQQVKNIVFEFRSILKATKRKRQNISRSRRKITDIHINSLSNYTFTKLGSNLTLADARSFLLDTFPNLGNVTTMTLVEFLGITWN